MKVMPGPDENMLARGLDPLIGQKKKLYSCKARERKRRYNLSRDTGGEQSRKGIILNEPAERRVVTRRRACRKNLHQRRKVWAKKSS